MHSSSTFLPVLRALAQTYQAIESYGAVHIRTLDLTPSQFDIIATLGNTSGMSCKELGEKTLITKGTLTGVIGRLEDKALVQRIGSETDGRIQTIQLTTEGEALFERIFPAHMTFLEQAFALCTPEEMATLKIVLQRLHESVGAARQQLNSDS